jgi:uncharacterized protein (DUF983 family)
VAQAGVSIWKAGLGARCPRCGEGRLYAGFLKLADRCDSCGLRLSELNAADGPAFFAMSAVGILVGFAALFAEVAYSPPVWVHLVVWFPLIAILSLLLLRPIKGVMVALTFRHRGFESRDEG